MKKIADISLRKKVPIAFGILLLLLVGVPSVLLYRYYYVSYSQNVEETLTAAISANVNELQTLMNSVETAIKFVNDNEKDYVTGSENRLSSIVDPIVNFQADSTSNNLYDFQYKLKLNERLFDELFEDTFNVAETQMKGLLIIDASYPATQYISEWRELKKTGIHNSTGAIEEEWYQETLKKEGKVYAFEQAEFPGRLFLAKHLKYQYVDNKMDYEIRSLGVIVASFNVSWIDERLRTSEITQRTQVFLVDENEDILYANEKALEGLSAAEVKDALHNIQEGSETYCKYGGVEFILQRNELACGLTMVAATPVTDIQKMTFDMARNLILVILLILMVAIILLLALNKMIIEPILSLAGQMEKGVVGEIDDSSLGKDEIGLLYQGYNRMQRKIQELLQEVWDNAEKRKKVEIQVLLAQINPHFVYNTLSAVSSYAILCGQGRIAKQLTSLSNIMRYNIKNSDALVPLKDEINIIRQYEEIQKLSYEDTVEFHYSVMPECETVLIPKLIIQPLVENSIIHGQGTQNEMIHIYIEASMQQNAVMTITVTDNGTGTDTEKINLYLQGKCKIKADGDSFGVRNVYERIKWYFGEEGTLAYHRNEKDNTVAVVTISVKDNLCKDK